MRLIVLATVLLIFSYGSIAQDNINDYLDRVTDEAAKGSGISAEILGRAYYFGFISYRLPNGKMQYFSVPKDHERAFRYLKKAAEKDNYDAAALAGVLVMNGDGVPQSDSEAIKFFESSYSRNEQARYYLSHFYYLSKDQKTREKGFELVKSTEYLDNPELLNMLAKYYENGVVVKRDRVLSEKLKSRAQELTQGRERLLNERIAAFEDNAKRKAEYGAAHDSASSQHQALMAVLSVMSVVATAAMVSNAGNLSLPSSAAPAPQGLTTHQMISYGIIK